jgi:predicted RNA binding protein YcfA (HicA-like mRNA interferase family)
LGRLRILSGGEVCRILEAEGFAQVRRRGSHVVMQQTIPGSTITVPVPDHPTLRIGTLQSIIRQSGVRRSLFETK